MMRRIAIAAFFITVASVCYADSTTPRLGLTLPTIGSPTWGTKVNGNFQILDATFTGPVGGNISTVTAGTGITITGSTGPLVTISLTGGTSAYIQNTATLQAGSTFFTQSGNINGKLTVLNGQSFAGTISTATITAVNSINQPLFYGYVAGSLLGAVGPLWVGENCAFGTCEQVHVNFSRVGNAPPLNSGILFENSVGISDTAADPDLHTLARTPIRFGDTGSDHYTALRASSTIAANVTYTLPPIDGTNGQVLTTNGSRDWSWTTVAGGGGSSSLAVGTGTASNFTNNVTSPTAAISFLGSQFVSVANGTTNFISLNQSSVTLQGIINPIFNQSSLQAGSTAYPAFLYVGSSMTSNGPAVFLSSVTLTNGDLGLPTTTTDAGRLALNWGSGIGFWVKSTDSNSLNYTTGAGITGRVFRFATPFSNFYTPLYLDIGSAANDPAPSPASTVASFQSDYATTASSYTLISLNHGVTNGANFYIGLKDSGVNPAGSAVGQFFVVGTTLTSRGAKSTVPIGNDLFTIDVSSQSTSGSAVLNGTMTIVTGSTFYSTINNGLNVPALANPTGVLIQAATSNTLAGAGNYGEVVSSGQAVLTNFPATTTYGDLASISLSSGAWMISMGACETLNGATVTSGGLFGISTTAGNSSTGLVEGDSVMYSPLATAVTDGCISIAGYFQAFSVKTTVYLKYKDAYTVGTPQATGRISAIRPY